MDTNNKSRVLSDKEVEEMRKRLNDPNYLNRAISNIADSMSSAIVKQNKHPLSR